MLIVDVEIEAIASTEHADARPAGPQATVPRVVQSVSFARIRLLAHVQLVRTSLARVWWIV